MILVLDISSSHLKIIFKKLIEIDGYLTNLYKYGKSCTKEIVERESHIGGSNLHFLKGSSL